MALVIVLAVIGVVPARLRRGRRPHHPALPARHRRDAGQVPGDGRPRAADHHPVRPDDPAVDMREQVVDVPPQEVITSDNVVVSVDAVIYYEPTDPQRLVYNVANFILAVTKLAQTNLRNVVGDLQLDEALTSRDKINVALRGDPRRRHRQVGRAGRPGRDPADRSAAGRHVGHARADEGRADPPGRGHRGPGPPRGRHHHAPRARRPSAILQAEGVKARSVLEAEGRAEAVRTFAEAEKFRQQAVAEGEADAIRSVYQAIHDGNPSNDLLAIKYLEALQKLGDGQATKIIVPTELSGVAGALAGVSELLDRPSSNGDD